MNMPTVDLTEKREVARCLSARLTYARHDRGLTQSGLAKRSRMKQGAVSHIENGKADLKLPTLHRIAHGLSTSMQWLTALSEPSEFDQIPVMLRPDAEVFDRDGLVLAFATRFRAARGRRGLSQQEAADAAHTWRRTVAGYERGEMLPHLCQAHHLAAVLAVPVGWLLEGGEDPWRS